MLITTLPPLSLFGQKVNWESKSPFYYVIAILTIGVMAATPTLAGSRLGAYLLAVREDLDSAEAAGSTP